MGELIIVILFFILGLLVIISANTLPDIYFETLGPSIFPKIISFTIVFLTAFFIIEKIFILKKNKKNFRISFNFSNILSKTNLLFLNKYKFVSITIINFFIYIILMKYFGFRISTFLFLLSTQWIIGPKKLKYLPIILIISIFISLGTFYFFQYFLNVHFPEGILFEYNI